MASSNAEVDPNTSHNDKLELVLSDSDGSSATASDNFASVIEQEDELMRERSVATTAYQDGGDMIIEDQHGEVMRVVPAKNKDSPYSSSSASSGSPFSSTSSSSVKNKDQQVYVHHIDKNITVEDKDGNVLRKYRIHNINREPQTRKKIKAATEKTLLKMKLKKGSSTNRSPHYVLEESFDNEKQESPLRNEKVERKLETKLNVMINQ